jgi:hypothetical protein
LSEASQQKVVGANLKQVTAILEELDALPIPQLHKFNTAASGTLAPGSFHRAGELRS